jgi:uncharacterized protein (UPF0333 family)
MNNGKMFEYLMHKKVITHMPKFKCYKCNICNNLLQYIDEKLDKNKQFRVIEHIKIQHKDIYKDIEYNIDKYSDLRMW